MDGADSADKMDTVDRTCAAYRASTTSTQSTRSTQLFFSAPVAWDSSFFVRLALDVPRDGGIIIHIDTPVVNGGGGDFCA